MNKQLIFDIGFHKGEDTRYYLYKDIMWLLLMQLKT